MPVTIKDVAARANVSPSTVSRTIRGTATISKKTQEKVRKAMEELGYEPLSSQDEKKEGNPPLSILGIVMPPAYQYSYDNPFYLEVIRGITQHSIGRNCLCVTIAGMSDEEVIRAIKDVQKQPFPSAFIVLFARKPDPIVDYLYDEGVEYVQIGQPSKHLSETVCIDNDNLQAGYDATAHLHHLGHDKIAIFGSPSSEIFSASRRRGYRLYLSEHGLALPEEYEIEMAQGDEEGQKKLAELIDLGNPNRPTAILVTDDIYAVIVRQLCAEKGIQIPQDLSIICFNNSLFSQLTYPEITTVDINSFQLGVEAASQAINHLENPGLMASRTIVPYQLVIRNSCMNLKTHEPELPED